MQTKKHYMEIDVLKGIAIAMVILGHAVIRYPINLHEVAWTKAIYDWVETMHMPLFFMVSGFCYSYKGNYRSFVNKKIQRILIPYVIFNLIDCVPRALLGVFVNRSRPIGESIKSMLLYGGEYWFLYVLMIIFLVFPLIEKAAKNRFGLALLVVGSCVLKFIPNLPDYFLIWRIAYHFFYFAVGYALKRFFDIEKASDWVQQNKLPSVGAMAAIIFVQIFSIPIYVTDYNQIYGIALASAGILLCYFFSVLCGQSIKKWLIGFGEYSLQLYLLNGFFLVFSRSLTINVLRIESPFIIVVVNMVFDLLISYLVIKYIFAKSKIFRRISGIV